MRLNGISSTVLVVLATLVVPGCTGGSRGDTGGTVGVSEQAIINSCVTVQQGVYGSVDDALISRKQLKTAFGALPILRTGKNDETLLRFDLGFIPPNAVVSSATMKLYINCGDGDCDDEDDGYCHAGPPVYVHRALAPWSEATVTYASFGQQYDPSIAGAFFPSLRSSLKSTDLRALAQAWVNGTRPNNGVLLTTPSSVKSVYVSSEGAWAYRPSLTVCYSLPDDHCVGSPCANGGTCTNTWLGYTCQCKPGYTGANCQTAINECGGAPCQNGGVCVSRCPGYACSCPAGFTGAHCETQVDNCAPNPCKNSGVCTNGVNSYKCACPAGFAGVNCEVNINDCAGNPCQNGGACTDRVNGYSCACPAGFSGANCEVNTNDCVGNQCQNGATCKDGVNSYTCDCLPDYAGALCENNINECRSAPCLNGGACINGVNNYTCVCQLGFTGNNCQVDINDCSPNPCLNGGVCTDRVNGFKCECPAGYSGATCDALVDNCAGNPCPPGTVCKNDVNTYTCQ